MKSTKIASTAQLDSLLDVCFDISKAQLNVYFELGDQGFDDEWPNTTRQIERRLRQCERPGPGARPQRAQSGL